MTNQKTSQKTEKTISMLMQGKTKISKKFAGKHVIVIKDKVVPMKTGEAFWRDYKRLQQEYKEMPITVFVPEPGVSYVLKLWL